MEPFAPFAPFSIQAGIHPYQTSSFQPPNLHLSRTVTPIPWELALKFYGNWLGGGERGMDSGLNATRRVFHSCLLCFNLNFVKQVNSVKQVNEIGLRVNFIFFVYQMRDGLRYKNKILQTWVVPIKNHALASVLVL